MPEPFISPEFGVEDLVTYKFWVNCAFDSVPKSRMQKVMAKRIYYPGMITIPGSKEIFMPYWVLPLPYRYARFIQMATTGSSIYEIAEELSLYKRELVRTMNLIHQDLRIMRFNKMVGLKAWKQIHAERPGVYPWEITKYRDLLPKEEVDYNYLSMSEVISKIKSATK